MKVLHCCLANFYIDNYGYQENILPKMHLQQGYEVYILASTETYTPNLSLGYVNASSYKTKDNIGITRVAYIKWLPKIISKKLRIYSGISNILLSFKPDIIFLHDCQFVSIFEIIKYIKKYKNTKLYADCHTDYVNSARGWISRYILHKIIYRICVKSIEKYVLKFYGTLPARNNFLREMYGIPSSKIELLPLGIDLTEIDINNREIIRYESRKALKINENDFVIITGGKIDKRKNIHLLIQAIQAIKINYIKLVLFGSLNTEMLLTYENLMKDSDNIINLGWISASEIPRLLLVGDLAFFPGTHSVLWEQCVGIGLPCVFKKWDKIQHVDVGGNCIFLEDISIESIKQTILNLYDNTELLNKMKGVAMKKGHQYFSYYEIAKKSIS